VAPPIVEGVIQGARAVGRPIATALRGAINPEEEAARRVVGAVERDVRVDPNAVSRLTPQEFAASAQQGGPATILDIGGETTRGLARSAANSSPEGRFALNQTINNRFEGQATRVINWLNSTFHYPNAHAQQEAIDQVQRTANRAGYNRAYAESAQRNPAGLWDEGFDQISQAPPVQDAIRKASITGASRAAREGFTPIGNPFVMDRATGRMTLRTDAQGNIIGRPNLQFWDEVKKNLDKAGGYEARDFARVLREHLDELAPSYRQARAGAAHFFGAENALEAGQNFVTAKLGNREARAALARMNDTERQLFQDGFVSRFVEMVNETGDRRNIMNMIGQSGAAREKLAIALGPRRAAELEAGLRVEGIMDLARGAVQGNSTTARQLAELGFASGAGGVGMYGTYNMDPAQMTYAAVAGALLAGRRYSDQRVAQAVARLLTSDNPQVLARGISYVARNQRFLDSLRVADRRIAAAGSEQVPTGMLPALQGAMSGRAENENP
jgi:hypothetical protein